MVALSQGCSPMFRRPFLLFAGSALLILAVDICLGQPQLGNQLPNPRVRTVMPCGNNAGATFEVTVSGSDLEEPEALVFSHPGITAKFVPDPPPPPPDLKQK